MIDFFSGIRTAANIALAQAVEKAGGEFSEIDFQEARECFLASLSFQDRMLLAAIEARQEETGEADRRTREAVELLEGLGAKGVPPADLLH